MDDGFNTSHLQYLTSPPGPTITISDWDVQNPTNANQIRYFLSAIDKMHDFESVYKAAIPNIRTTHFNVVDGNAAKWINATENASTKLTASAGTLQQIIDFKSYIKSVAMEGAAPQLTIGTSSFNYADKAPFTMHTMNVVSDLGEYKTLLPPTRDCFISLRGTAAEFDANAGRIRDLLNVGEGGAYVSKDAFPLDSETVSKIFRVANGNDKFPFGSYLSQLLDPATETKIILPVSKPVTIQSLYCVLSGDRRLFIEINMQTGGGERNAKIKFGISSAGPAINWSTEPAITINNKTPIPSIQDCVVWMLGNNTKTLKKTGAKIWNALKTGNLKQNTQAATMDGYFSMILANIAGIPGIGTLSPEDKDLIAIASKTNGDQSYKWDQLIADALGYQTSLHGTYKVTVDYYEFLDDVHSKQVNSVFASKSGRSLTTGRSIYTMTIYLKPLSETAATEFKAAAEAAKNKLQEKIKAHRDGLTVDMIIGLRATFVTKLTELLAEFQTRFTDYLPMNENSRNTKYRYGETIDIESQQIANQYYSACQIVLDILGKIWSLDKAINKINLSVANDLPTLQLLISAKNAYDDAAAYSTGFATASAANGAFTKDLTEWTKQGSGIDSVVNSFNYQIGVLSKNMFPISNVVPVKGLYGLSKPIIIGWFEYINDRFNEWKQPINVVPGGYKPSVAKTARPSAAKPYSKGFINPIAHKIIMTEDDSGEMIPELVSMTRREMQKKQRTQQNTSRMMKADPYHVTKITGLPPAKLTSYQKNIVWNKAQEQLQRTIVAKFEKELLKEMPQLGQTLDSYIAYMGTVDLTNINDVYDCYELLSYLKYRLDMDYPDYDIFYESVFYIIGGVANGYAMSMHENGDDSTFQVHHRVWDASQMASPNYPLYHPSSYLTKYDGGGKKTSRRKARRTIQKRPNKMHMRTKRNRRQK
jgi:hypothetical protein